MMNQILEVLYLQIKSKLKDDGISIPARNLLTDMKNKLKKLRKRELTLDDLPEIETKIDKYKTQLKELNEQENKIKE